MSYQTADDLRALVKAAASGLHTFDGARYSAKPGPGKWSPQELLGHLIDSASNNHQRFVRARFQDGLRFPGYDQDDWVTAQAYTRAPWGELIELFLQYNLHLARVMESTPEPIRTALRTDHNLDAIAFVTVPATQAVTLDYFMRDYLEHLRHHLVSLDLPLP